MTSTLPSASASTSARAEASSDVSVQLIGLTREFPGSDTPAVAGIDLDIRRGEFFSLIGPSGCGKTTTLRMLAGLELPSSGQILLDGRDVAAVPAYRRNVHTVFQNYALFPHLDVAGNVGFGLREKKGMPKAVIADKVDRMLDLVGLTGRGGLKPSALSGGMQQRVALARALVLDPAVLLLDEPLGALDLKLRRQMQELLKEVQREVGITFVYVTHDQEEAFSMSDRVGIMSGGHLAQVAAPREAYHHPATPFVATFVGSSNLIPGVVTGVAGSHLHVNTALLGDVTIPGVETLAAGDEARVLIRPEFLEVASGGAEGIAATVTGTTFLGNHLRVNAVSADATVLKADLFGSQAYLDLAAGDVVRLRAAERDLWAVPATD
jgi:spermidine/putrescine transport system ATP-binding protein